MENPSNNALRRYRSKVRGSYRVLLLVSACACSLTGWAAPRSEAHRNSPKLDTAKAESMAAPTLVKQAHLRLWKTATSSDHVIHVKVGTASHAVSVPNLGPAEKGYSFGNYVELPSGHLSFEAVDMAATKPEDALLARCELDLREDSYGTVLLSIGADAHWRAQYISDDLSLDAANSGQLTVRSLTPDLASFNLRVGDTLSASFASPAGYLQMFGFPLGSAQISTSGKLANGQAFEWNTGVNFGSSRRVTLLIFPDVYGRVRPRLLIDGPVPVVEEPASTPDKKGQ